MWSLLLNKTDGSDWKPFEGTFYACLTVMHTCRTEVGIWGCNIVRLELFGFG